MTYARRRVTVLGTPIDAVDREWACRTVLEWARSRSSRYVCACNAHSLVTASADPSFLRVLSEADLAVPDGMPVAWALRRLGATQQKRVDGPGLMWRLCELAAENGISVGFYGSTDSTLLALRARLQAALPLLRIATMVAPPFRPLSVEEDAAVVSQFNDGGAGIVFVGLGCPKQECWMADHRETIPAVMIGVGAAFDFHAGTLRRAPGWMRESGLEWAHRLAMEPMRLWKRYLIGNLVFTARLLPELLRHWRSPGRAH